MGSGELVSSMISGISVQPRMTQSLPCARMRGQADVVIVGAGSVVYFASIVTALFVEGETDAVLAGLGYRSVFAGQKSNVIGFDPTPAKNENGAMFGRP